MGLGGGLIRVGGKVNHVKIAFFESVISWDASEYPKCQNCSWVSWIFDFEEEADCIQF
jgi:hypothetical protein